MMKEAIYLEQARGAITVTLEVIYLIRFDVVTLQSFQSSGSREKRVDLSDKAMMCCSRIGIFSSFERDDQSAIVLDIILWDGLFEHRVYIVHSVDASNPTSFISFSLPHTHSLSPSNPCQCGSACNCSDAKST